MPELLDPERLLPLVLLGIYIADSLMLMGPYDLLLESRRAGRHVPLFPARSYRIARKAPLLLNPLTPWRLLARYRWDAPREADTVTGPAVPRGEFHAWLATLATLLMIALMVGIPVSLFIVGLTRIKIAMIAECYLLVLIIAIGTFFGRRALGMTMGEAAQRAFEILLCPPLAINFPRKLGLSVTKSLDLETLDETSAQRAREAIAQRIGDRIALLDEDSEESTRLKVILSSLPPAEAP